MIYRSRCPQQRRYIMKNYLSNEQLCNLYALKQRIELMDLVRNADDERIRLILKLTEIDQRSLEAVLLAAKTVRDM